MVANQLLVVERGRQPDLELIDGGVSVPLLAWAGRLLDQCVRVAAAVDAVTGVEAHTEAVALQRRKVAQPELTPSARVLNALGQQRVPFFRFAMNQSAAHRGYFEERPLSPERHKELTAMSDESLAAQARMEAGDRESFEAYLKRFLELDIPGQETR